VKPLLAAALAAIVLGGAAHSGAGRVAPSGRYWIVLASDRDGELRAYSVRPDGSRLTPLYPRGSVQRWLAISGDGRTIAYEQPDGEGISVSRADGTARRVLTRDGSSPALTRNGKRLAFTFGYPPRVAVVGADGRGRRTLTSGFGDEPEWSPDGSRLVVHRESKTKEELIVQPLHGKPRALVRGPAVFGPDSPDWSPDGRWIAYLDKRGLWVIQPDGKHRHLVAKGFPYPFAWSADGTQLAYKPDYTGTIAFVGVGGGRPRRLHLRGVPPIGALAWSPDGRRLALQAPIDPSPQIWVVGVDGRGLRRLTSGGTNGLVGWTQLAPVGPAAPPLLPSERVAGPRRVDARRPITDLSADGSRVAFAVAATAAECFHVAVWTPVTKSLDRFGRPKPCEVYNGAGDVYGLALAGSRAGWTQVLSCGNFCDVALRTATLAAPSPLDLAAGSVEADSERDFHLRGHDDLLVYDDESRLVRIGTGGERCQDRGDYDARICTTLRRGDFAAGADSVWGGLIAVREPNAVAVLDEQGKLVRFFPFGVDEVRAARLDGSHLVVARAGVLEVYDAKTGAAELQRPLPNGYELVDVDGGVAVLQRAKTIMLLRLGDGHALTLSPGGEPVLAQLEPPGLYYSSTTAVGDGRLVFLPKAELDRALG
jgi:hypothetical protein